MGSRIIAISTEIWHKSAVPVFLERFVLPLFAGAVILLGITNPMGFDRAQRITGTIALIFGAYFVAHTVYTSQTKPQDKVVPVTTPDTTPAPVPPTQLPPSTKTESPKRAAKKPRDEHPAVSSPDKDWLTDTQKENIASILREREKEKGNVRLVCIGEPPKYADQIQEAFEAAHWPIQRLEIGSATFSGTGPMSEPLYILAPHVDSLTVRAVVDALEYGRVAAPIHTDMPTIGPGSLGVPAVTIVVQKK